MCLISSPRHTSRDLAAWQRWAGQDALLSQSPDLDRLERQALAAIVKFADGGDCVAGTSWGKDSVVLAHLVWRSGLPIQMMRMVQARANRIESPEVPQVRDEFLARFPMEYAEFMSSADDGLGDMNRHTGGRYLSGVRADEASSRELTIRRNGLVSTNSARPIGYWKAWHVWAYLAKHDLPIHPAYACTHGGVLNRDRVRVHSFGGTEQGSGVGRLTWERDYYGEVWRELDRRAAAECV